MPIDIFRFVDSPLWVEAFYMHAAQGGHVLSLKNASSRVAKMFRDIIVNEKQSA